MTKKIVHLGSVAVRFGISEGVARHCHMASSAFGHAAIQAIIGGLVVLLGGMVNLTVSYRGFLQRLQPRASEMNALVANQVSCPFADLPPSGSVEG